MLLHRLRRWPGIKPTMMGQRLVLVGIWYIWICIMAAGEKCLYKVYYPHYKSQYLVSSEVFEIWND